MHEGVCGVGFISILFWVFSLLLSDILVWVFLSISLKLMFSSLLCSVSSRRLCVGLRVSYSGYDLQGVGKALSEVNS